MVRPQLDYGNDVLCPYLRKDIDSIEAVQKRFTKLIPGVKNLSYQDRLKHLTTIIPKNHADADK